MNLLNDCPPTQRPSPHDILSFVSYACFQLEAPFRLKINVVQIEYVRPEEKGKKRKKGISTQVTRPGTGTGPVATPTVQDEEVLETPEIFDDSEEIVLTAIMDNDGHLLELVFNRCVEIPRLLIKVICFCLPFQPYLYRLTVRWGPLTSAALYEFSKFLAQSTLTEICLDDSPVAGRNYEVLLEQPSRLRYLSLARCKLDDEDCAKLCALLLHPRPASKTLNILILASNRISDQGARALGHVLRTNRCLLSLNLAGNVITDFGANSIYRSLMEFPLTNEEVYGKRLRHMEYLKRRNEVYANAIKELGSEKWLDDVRPNKRKLITRVSKKNIGATSTVQAISQALHHKATVLTNERIGLFIDPFSKDQTVSRDDRLYCRGNLSLSSLNLSYNNLEYPSLSTLLEVLTYQSWIGPKATTGLLRIYIEGNNMPIDCDEFILIDDFLEKAQASKGPKVARRISVKLKSARV